MFRVYLKAERGHTCPFTLPETYVQTQKSSSRHNLWPEEFIGGRGAAGVSEKGSVVCKTGMAFLTLDIHQLSERWQRISSHSVPGDPLLKRAGALPISDPNPTFKLPWKLLVGVCVADLRQESLYLSSSILLWGMGLAGGETGSDRGGWWACLCPADPRLASVHSPTDPHYTLPWKIGYPQSDKAVRAHMNKQMSVKQLLQLFLDYPWECWYIIAHLNWFAKIRWTGQISDGNRFVFVHKKKRICSQLVQ